MHVKPDLAAGISRAFTRFARWLFLAAARAQSDYYVLVAKARAARGGGI